jgi:hypothetical protein
MVNYNYEVKGNVNCNHEQIQKFLNGLDKLMKELKITETKEFGATYKG